MQISLSSLPLLKTSFPLPGAKQALQHALPTMAADTFTPQVRFGAKSSPFPPLEDALASEQLLASFERNPFQAGFDEIMEKAVEAMKLSPATEPFVDTTHGTLGTFIRGTISILSSLAKEVEDLQEDRKMLNQQGKQMLELLESVMPAEASQRRFKADALHRLFYTHYEKGEEHFAKTKSSHVEGDIDPGIPLPNIRKRKEAGKTASVVLSPAFRQVVTGFVQQRASVLDRKLPDFFKYITQLEGKPGVPQEVNDAAAYIREFNASIVKGVKLGTITKTLEQNSPEGFRLKLSELWNTAVPVNQRLMNETQHAAVERMIEAMERSQSGDPSRETLLNQLSTLLYQVPWNKTEEKNYTKADIRKSLDDDHFGLDDVKTKVVDHAGKELHLRKLKAAGLQPKRKGKPTIVCLVGPPGVGKTSIGKSIADATGRNFTRIALGGVSDEAEIRGHRSTYIGSKTGKIIEGLIQAKSTNPVFMLDEIGAMSGTVKGDPAAALLEVLDPEQNNSFTDNYLGVPIDLSQVMFICTANDLSRIPPALRDRMQIIELKGYTTDEKVQIAQRHLIPKARAGNGLDMATLGLSEEPFNVSEDELVDLMNGYAPERGVRQLETCLNAMAEKTASQISDLPGLPKLNDFPAVSPNRVKEMLGRPQFKLEKIDFTPMPGRVNYMYFSEGARPGGTGALDVILNAKPVTRKGQKGGLVLGRVTGNLGKVMTESAHRAFDFIKCNVERLGIPDLDKNQIEVFISAQHQNGVEGPSAGTALALALISALTNRPVRRDFPITGPFTLRGEVLAIGGVREKVTGAVEEGAKVIIVPEANRDDLEDVPESVKKQATIHIVKTLDDVMKVAFADEAPQAAAPVKFAGANPLRVIA